MTEPITPPAITLVLSHGDDTITDTIASTLTRRGSRVTVSREDARAAVADLPEDTAAIDAVVYISGLVTGTITAAHAADPARHLLALVNALSTHNLIGATEGSRVVTVLSRDWLGWPSRPHNAAAAAALVAAVRSAALAHGRKGITVNAVAALPDDAFEKRSAGPTPGTQLVEPAPLTGIAVSADDIAAAVEFLLDRRSTYITGQVLQCCGGASLLSSMSA
ncbi:SDR family oxidoreductase [soil metagenome]